MMLGLRPKARAVPTYEAAVTMPTAVLWEPEGTLRAMSEWMEGKATPCRGKEG